MLKHAKRLAAAASTATVAGLVAVGGLSAASASPAVHAGTRATVHTGARAAVRPSVSGTEHFQLMTTSATSNKGHVIAYGLFTGPAVDIMGNTTDTFKFSGGSFRIKHSPGRGPQHFNPRSCLLTINEHGTYTLSNGTGKYAGISGHGKYRFSILALAARRANGTCNMSQSKAPVAFQQIISASGPVRL
jgi:hypothetical protein